MFSTEELPMRREGLMNNDGDIDHLVFFSKEEPV
jgi:hypothetical protein